jgi:hypothetical protein
MVCHSFVVRSSCPVTPHRRKFLCWLFELSKTFAAVRLAVAGAPGASWSTISDARNEFGPRSTRRFSSLALRAGRGRGTAADRGGGTFLLAFRDVRCDDNCVKFRFLSTPRFRARGFSLPSSCPSQSCCQTLPRALAHERRSIPLGEMVHTDTRRGPGR